MITPEEFIKRWGSKEVLLKYSMRSLSDVSMSDADKRFLIEAGLPDSAAPFLSFESPERGPLPTVMEIWHQDDRFRRYRIIGFNGSGDPLALDDGAEGEVVYLNHDNYFQRVFVNSSVRQLAECLLLYREMVDDAITTNGKDALLERRIPSKGRLRLEQDLRRTDRKAMEAHCMWWDELQALFAEGPS